MKKIELVLETCLIFLCLISCSKDLPNRNLTPIKSIERLSDSTYLSDVVSNMVYYNNTLFFSDCSNSRIVNLDSNYRVIRIYGSPGRGPGEFLTPDQFAIVKDSLYVFDHSTKKILIFDMIGKFSREFNLNRYPEVYSRLAISKFGKIYVSTPLLDYPITVFDRNGNILYGIGSKCNNKLAFYKKMASISHLLIYKDSFLLSVRASSAEIDVYDLEGLYIKKIDLSNLDIVKDLLKFFNETKRQDGIPSIFTDVSLYDDKLFLKTASANDGTYNSNIIIECKLNQLDIKPVTSFTITSKGGGTGMLLYFGAKSKEIIGFNQSTQSLDIFQF